MARRTIKVESLARVEGEGALDVRIREGRVDEVRLRIFEPPRFFEALLRGRDFREAPDITARICGICPVAYQMSAVHAMEDACGVSVPPAIRALRRLIYCGEWIESHALHVYMLHAPDFLGYEDAISMVRDHRAAVERGLGLKKIGNALIALLGGREIHPINVRVGGFYRAPSKGDLLGIVDDLRRARDAALETVRWTATLPFPDFERDYELVALRHPADYPFNEGRIVSSRGIDAEPSAFDETFEELQVPHSTALHARVRGRGTYFVGPLARFNLNLDRLSPLAAEAARDAGLEHGCRNPYKSIIVRAIEITYACDEALRLIDAYEPPAEPSVDVTPRAGVGHACTEAPRGILYHRYEIAGDGKIVDARIVPPTSQNQSEIEADLRAVVAGSLDKPDDELRKLCEQTIRNYDPCISCSAHFLRLNVDRT